MLETLDTQRLLPGRIPVPGIFLLLFLFLLSLTNAQTTSPPPTTRGEYATVNNTFYIQGGSLSIDGTQLTPGIFSLDLTVPWSDQSPPWKILPNAGLGVAPLAYQQSMTPTGDRTQLVIWNVERFQMTNFQLSNNTWGPPLTYSTGNINWGGLKAVIPPTAPGTLGVIHMPNGCWNLTQSPSALCTYNLDTLQWIQTPMPTGYLPTDVSYYTFVYSNLRKSMVMYGGTSVFQNGPSPYLYEYLPETKTWTFLQSQAKGTLPGDIYYHCMVESTDFSKMIMFGGASGNTTVTVNASLFILDLTTLTWTKGADAPSSEARLGHACAVNGDSFIVWGGSNLQSMMSTTPLIYNVRLNQWVHDFVVSGPLPTISTSTGSRPTSGGSGSQPSGVPNTTPPTTEKSSSSSGGITGGIVGGVVVLAAVGFFFYRRSKKHQPISPLTKQNEGQNESTIHRQDRTDHDKGGQLQWIPLQESDSAPSMKSPYVSSHQDGSSFTYLQETAIPPQPFQTATTIPSSPFSDSSPYRASNLYETYQASSSYPSSPAVSNSYPASLHSNIVHAGSISTEASASPPKLSPRPTQSPQGIMGGFGLSPQVLPTPVGNYSLNELRNPQQLDAGSTSTASGPGVFSQASGSSHHSPYFPPPPPMSPPISTLVSSQGVSESIVAANDEVMAKKLALMKAQYEFELSRIRLEQESLVERQRRQQG